MKGLKKTYQQNLDWWTESIKNDIFERGTSASDSIKNKGITNMKGECCFTVGYQKHVK